MAVDIASLIMAVDARQVDAGTKSLDKLTTAGKQAEASTLALAAASKVLAAATEYVVKGFALYKMADLIRDSAMLAARYETMAVVMKVAGNNAGYTRAEMEAYSKALQKTGISMMESRNVLTQLSTANIELANAAKLGRAAQDLAVVGNINSSEALQRMVHGIKSGEIEILRTLGLNTSFEKSYKTLAAQLGTTSEKLTENQKTTARTNAVLTEAIKYQGIYEESMNTAGKAMTSLTRYWEDLKVKMGEAFLPTVTTAVFALTDGLKEMNKELDTAGQTGLITDIGEALSGIFKVALQATIVLVSTVATNFKVFGLELGALGAQIAAFARGDMAGVGEIGRQVQKDTEAVVAAADKFEKKILGVGATEAAVATARVTMTETQRIAVGKAAREAQEAADKKAAADKLAAEAAKKLSGEQKSYLEGLEKEAAAIGRSTEEKKLQEAVVLKLTGARLEHVKALLLEMAQYQLAEDKAKERADLRNNEYADIEALMKAEKLRLVESGNAADAAVRAARDEYAQHGLLKSAVMELTLVKMEGRAKMLQPDSEAYASLQREIAAQKELIGIAKKTEVRDADEKAAKDAAAEWKRASEQIEQSLTDALMDGFNAGKGFGKSFVDSVTSMFKTMVLRPVISAIVTGATGALGFGGTANAATGGVGGGDLLSAGSSLFGMAGAGSAIGSSFGAGMSATFSGMTGSALSSGATMMGMQGGVMSGAATMLGAVAPYLAAAVAIYSIAKSLDHSGTPHTGGGAFYSASSGLSSTPVGSWTGGTTWGDSFGSVLGSADATQMTAGIAQSIVGMLDSTASAFGQKAGYAAATSFADDSSKDGAWGSLLLKLGDTVLTDWNAARTSKWAPRVFSDGAAGSAEYLAAISADVNTALRSILDSADIPQWAKDMATKLGASPTLEQMAATVGQITAIQNAIVAQRAGLQQQLDLLTGVTTQRELERAALDETNRALYDQIKAFEDQKTSAEQAADAISKSVGSVVRDIENAARAMESAMGDVNDEIKRLRGLAAVGSGAGAAYYGAQFATLTAQARAGSVSAMAQLPGISAALESAQLATATTSLDKARIRSRIANSLSDTIGLTEGASLGDPQATPLAATVQTLKDNNARLEALVQTLIDKLVEVQAETQSSAISNSKVASILMRVTPEGDAVATRVAA